MKKILLAGLVSLMASTAIAFPNVYRSSNTATIDTAQALCTKGGAVRRGILHTACVNTGAAGTLTIFNAFSTGVNPIAAINTVAALCQTYDIVTSSGLTYTNSATANITLSYDCY